MIKYYLFLIIFLTCFKPQYSCAQDRRSKIINIIIQEINEVQRISNQTTGFNPAFELRKAELFLEKARLERELENERFLKVNPRQRNSSLKRQIFKKSNTSLKVAEQTCQQIIRKSPGYSDIGDVYYILAYYSKEQGDYNQALRNFNQSRRLSRSSELVKRSEIAMAEIFYVRNRCDQSIKLYERAIPRTNNKWKTKDLYNYSWCLYKTGKTNSAIRTMKESYRLSQQEQYINMSDRINKDIIVFYVQAQQYNQALSFINNSKGSKKSAVDELVRRLLDGGQNTQATSLLKKVILNAKGSEKKYYLVKLYLTYQNLDWKEAQSIIPKLSKLIRSSKLENKSLIQKKAASFISYIQSILLNNKIDSIQTKKIMALSAYKHSQLIVSPESSRVKINLVLAEIFQSIGQKKTAYDLYMKSFTSSRHNPAYAKIKDASLEGALLVVESNNLDDLEKIYEYYLSDSSRTNKHQLISGKLFKVYMTNQKPKRAQELLQQYQKRYPNSLRQRESMLAQLFEYYENNRNSSEIESLILAVNTDVYRVSPTYKSKIGLLTNNLIQKKANLSLQKGDWESAIVNFKKAYRVNQDPKLKADAALNIASLYSNNNRIPESIIWLQKSLNTMNSGDIENSADQINRLTSKMFYQGYIDQSTNLQRISWNRSCQNYSLFENLFVLSKASLKVQDTVNLLVKARQCRSLSHKLKILASSYAEELEIQNINNPSTIYDKPYRELRRNFRIPIKDQFEAKKIRNISNLANLIKSSVLSSKPEILVVQIKKLLNRLANMNSIASKMKSYLSLKIDAFSKILSSYNQASLKINEILRKNQNEDLNLALNPVIETLRQQKNNVFSSAMKTISQVPNYSIHNHELLLRLKEHRK